jgi:hypothetical protein
MTPEEHQMLETSLRLAEQNNRMLKRLHRSMLFGRILSIIYWLFIFAVAFGVYYVIRPYLGPVGQLIDKAGEVANVPNLPKL